MTLEASMEAKLNELRDEWNVQQPFTIFRVPAYVRESNRTSYEPRMVSIGPYYHGAAELRAMEDHKWRYLDRFLRDCAPAVSASALVGEMRLLEARARACYGERPAGLDDSDGFVRMLLLDGCFILEFFFMWRRNDADALCDVGWGLTLVLFDLLLMENQIPFFVLEKLYEVVAGPLGGKQSLLNLLVEFIAEAGMKLIEEPSDAWEIHHLLHLCYKSFVPKRTSRRSPAPAPAPRTIPRASEMSEAGVTFVVPRSNARDSFDVAFDGRRGVMEIPTIKIDDAKRPLLANLIALEQSQVAAESRVLTSYVVLMGQLINTAKDVELLRRRGILDNLLAGDEEAAQFFRHLDDCGLMNYECQAFLGLYEDVNRYCGTWWRKNMAALKRDYFGSPWSVVAFLVAVFALFLTAVQTYFTVFPSKH